MATVKRAAPKLGDGIVTLPVGVRAHCRRDPPAERRWHRNRAITLAPQPKEAPSGQWKTPDRPVRFIAFDTECVTPATAAMTGFDGAEWRDGQKLLFGTALIGWTRGMRVADEIIFYDDDLPVEGVEILRRHFEAIGMVAGNRRVLRDRQRVNIRFMPRSEFVEILFQEACRRKALVIGFNLPFDLGRLAWRSSPGRGDGRGGWSLELSSRIGDDGERIADRFRPRIAAKPVTRDVTFIRWGGSAGKDKDGKTARKSWGWGEWLDLGNLLFGLTNSRWTLAAASRTFCNLALDKDQEHGVITPAYVEYARGDVWATVALAGRLLDLFDLHPESRARGGKLSECRVYSPAAFARATPSATGLAAPALPDDRIGSCSAAFFGGIAETGARGRVPVVDLDFSKQYQRIAILLGLQRFLACEEIAFTPAMEEACAFLAAATIRTVFDAARWPELCVLCWVVPNGEILPGKFDFAATAGHPPSDGDDFTMSLAHRHGDRAEPFWLADLVAAKLRDPKGRMAKIARAERLVPSGAARALRKVRLLDGPQNGREPLAAFDPETEIFWRRNVETGEAIKTGKRRWSSLSQEVRDALYVGVKAIGNSAAVGIFSETREADLPADTLEEVTLCGDGEPTPALTAVPEEPGRFYNPALAGLVTAGGRLMLAAIDCLVTARGGAIAFCNTDSAAIIATREGGVPLDAKDRRRWDLTGGCRPLSWADVAGIAAAFQPLHAGLPGLVLKIEPVNFRDGEQVQLEALAIAPNIYNLSQRGGTTYADAKASIMGAYLPPCDPPDEWIGEAWRAVDALFDRRPPAPRSWLLCPAVRPVSASTPAFAETLGLADVRPFDFCMTATALGQKNEGGRIVRDRRAVVAPLDHRPERWAGARWTFARDGKPFRRGVPDDDGYVWELRTVAQMLRDLADHHPRDKLAPPTPAHPDPGPADRFTRGILRRMAIRDGERWLLSKDTLWSEADHDLDRLLGTKPRIAARQKASVPGPDPDEWDWADTIRPALLAVGPAAAAKGAKMAPRTAQRWLAGERQPTREGMERLAMALSDLAYEAGLILPGEERLPDATICARAAERAGICQMFLSAATAMLGLADIKAATIAAATEAPQTDLTDWGCLAHVGGATPIAEINTATARLATMARAALRSAHRRPPSPGIVGDRQALLAWLGMIAGRAKPVVPKPGEIFACMAGVVSLVFRGWFVPACEFAGHLREKAPPPEPGSLKSFEQMIAEIRAIETHDFTEAAE